MAAKITEPCSIRIRKALSMRNMTQSDLCEKAKISKSTLSEYLKGLYEPKQDKIYMLSQALSVNPAWLMGFDAQMEIDDIQKSSPNEPSLTEGEKMMLGIFRLIPEEQQRAFLEMGRAYANSLKKD